MSELDKSLKKDLDRIEIKPYDDLAEQIKAEYSLAWDHQRPKRAEAEVRLKLYNNQKREKAAVGDSTMFTIFQTLLASLYADRLMSEWGGREEGDEEVAENLNALAEYDYTEMMKDITDFFWIWDTIFFGRGLLELSQFERDPDNNIFYPVPKVYDPCTFLRDPGAVAINGETRTGDNACRFFGREIRMTKEQIKNHPHFFDKDLRGYKFGGGIDSLIQKTEEARNAAQGLEYQKFKKEQSLKENGQYEILEWSTHLRIGSKLKKVKVWLKNQRAKMCGMQVLDTGYWPVIDRPLYPTSHDWDGTSIPDLTEDKQRARAVAQNLGLDAMKADLYPMYVFDSNKIVNRNDLNFNFNKFIPIDGPIAGAIQPLIKARPNMNLLDFIYNSLDASAQRATATPELQQGVISQEKRTLGEVNIVASKVDTRYSLSAKIFGWSESAFWRQWYQLYKENFAEKIDEKIVDVSGAFGPKWRKLSRKDIVTKRLDPNVKIESQILSRAKQLEERASLTGFFSLVLQEPTSNRRYGLKKLAKLNGMKKDEIDRLLPPTVDERIAERQNENLNNNKTVPVLPEDDHNVHLEIHSKAKDTPATMAHIQTHEEALSLKKIKPELFPQEPEAASFQPSGSKEMLPVTPKMGMVRPLAPSQTSGQFATA